ncbi:hypothetical protein ACP4OV_023058 [Aristida adscensionis]
MSATGLMLSARRQVLAELGRLVAHFRREHAEEKIRVTATGHSLGGALAVLTARDAAADTELAGVRVTTVTFGGPRVGDRAFSDELVRSCGGGILRVAIKQDVVPRLPLELMGYVHAGDELLIDGEELPEPRKWRAPWQFHSLDMYMRLLVLGGGESPAAGAFRWDMDYCETPTPELGKVHSSLKLSKLDEIIYAEKKTNSPMPHIL